MGKTDSSSWISLQINLGLTANTISAYRRALDDYVKFCTCYKIDVLTASREHIALYIRNLSTRPVQSNLYSNENQPHGLSNATIQQKLTALRLYYDFLIEEGVRTNNPVGRGRYTQGKRDLNNSQKGLIPRYKKLPWIPNDEEWHVILKAAKTESIRNRLMFAMDYDAGLRREELCLLKTSDIGPAHRTLHIRAETTKGRRARVVPYSAPTGELLSKYLQHRCILTKERGALFISESPRNYAQAIIRWSWSKVIPKIAKESGVLKFSTHTLRHLCLTDLARAGWELHEISIFAGHRNTSTTLLYIHLSGRELVEKFARATTLHVQRLRQIVE